MNINLASQEKTDTFISMKPPRVLLTKSNIKIEKSIKLGYLTVGLHLAPHKLAGINVCPGASPGCILSCLNTSGHGVFTRTQNSRIAKTQSFHLDQKTFMRQLIKEIENAKNQAKKKELKLAVRLNLTSDVQFENILIDGKTIFATFPDVNFYDYTAIVKRMLPDSKAQGIKNYHLTFSRKENNQAFVELVLKNPKVNVSVVFAKTPKTYLGRKVVSGDISDLRFLDKKGVIVALTPKGKAKKDLSGFVVL